MLLRQRDLGAIKADARRFDEHVDMLEGMSDRVGAEGAFDVAETRPAPRHAG